MSSRELYHYGILGMKWGVRRTPEQLGHKPSNSIVDRIRKKRKAKNERKAAKNEARRRFEAVEGPMRKSEASYKKAYDQTKEGKRKRSEYAKWYENALNDYSAETEQRYARAEKDYSESR